MKPSDEKILRDTLLKHLKDARHLLMEHHASHISNRPAGDICPVCAGQVPTFEEWDRTIRQAEGIQPMKAPDITLLRNTLTASISQSIEQAVRENPRLARGQVWCTVCGVSQKVNSSSALRCGWPKHCGYTMTIDSPEERAGTAPKNGADGG